METFNVREQLREVPGFPGHREAETQRAIAINLAGIMKLTGEYLHNELCQDNYSVFKEPEVLENLQDIAELINEYTFYLKTDENETGETEGNVF